MPFYIVAALVIIADQVTKYLVRVNISEGDTLLFWGMQLTHYENAGMAHSLFQGYARLFGVAAILFVAGVFYFRKQMEQKGTLLEISLGFLVGAAIGNAIDRFLFGQVTDFLLSPSGKGILNLADHAINIGFLLLIINGGMQVYRKWKSGSVRSYRKS
ncbi:signal peptidase II [Brevibacillus fluminis]|uniref:Lipoprotein signal peptidase n=2 Tax=Brevibacillus fluminis TaxID=511487 RepID=A0A3M8DUP9_9BACL|nr:signal peptidase II [Brevibacillus fluminis]